MILIRSCLPYWYVEAYDIWGNSITGHMRVTLGHEYIMIWWIHFFFNRITRCMQRSLVTFSYSRNRNFHWLVHHVTCSGVSSDLSRRDISIVQVRYMIVSRLNQPTLSSPFTALTWFHGCMVTVYMDVSNTCNKLKCVFCRENVSIQYTSAGFRMRNF